MTIKELADIAGVSQETIRRYGKQHFPSFHSNGRKVDYDDDISKIIISEVKKKNMVSLDNTPTQNVAKPTQNVDVVQMFSMMMQQQQQFMSAVLGEIKNISAPKQLQLEQPKQDYFSLLAYCNLKQIKITHSESILHGKALRRICNENNKELRAIPDERWGKVNSYPVDVLEEYFTV